MFLCMLDNLKNIKINVILYVSKKCPGNKNLSTGFQEPFDLNLVAGCMCEKF